MSTGAEDYIIFDYLRYVQEILPALEQLERGNQLPLRSLIIDASHCAKSFSVSPLPHLNGRLRGSWEPMACLFDALARHQDLAALVPLDEYALFSSILSLRESSSDNELLRTCLLTIYCCEVLPWSPDWKWPYHGNFLLDHDEWILEWGAYVQRDPAQAALWGAFSQPAPEPLRHYLQADFQKQISYYSTDFPRSISTPPLWGQITGFMTIEEIQHLLEEVRIHEMPPIEQLAEFVERAGSTQPEEAEEYRQWYCQRLWMIEEEILHRMRYALAHGKGILTYYRN